MKTNRKLNYAGIMIATILFAIGIIFSGCKKKEGPPGKDGKDGQDLNANCTQCHEFGTDLYAKIVQYEASVHATGLNFERATASCAGCHTHEGFMERMETGNVAGDILNPTPQNCRTCHNIHLNYDSTDYELTTTDPVTLMVNSETVNFGKGNLCANCHQGRIPNPLPVPDGSDVIITSTYFGQHHGPQANILGGTGGFEISGSLAYTNSYHTNGTANGCVDCHMAPPFGNQAGGHTMNLTYEYHENDEPLTTGCEAAGCHNSMPDFDYNGVQTEIQALLDELKDSLITNGITDSAGIIIKDTIPANSAGAYLNYQIVLEDRSRGVHNTKYTRALLQNAIEVF